MMQKRHFNVFDVKQQLLLKPVNEEEITLYTISEQGKLVSLLRLFCF